MRIASKVGFRGALIHVLVLMRDLTLLLLQNCLFWNARAPKHGSHVDNVPAA